MNTTIYLTTIKKVLKNKFLLVMLFLVGIVMPLSMSLSPEPPSLSSVDGWDAFAVSTLVGLITVTASNVVGNTLSVGGRSDYMPLIVTRPIHRYQYVIAKWLAIATIISIAQVLQHLFLTGTGAYSRWGLTEEMVVLGFAERVVSALSVSSVLTLIYLLPSQTMVLCGILSFELAVGFSVFALNISMPMLQSSGNLIEMSLEILGVRQWTAQTLLPSILGGNATASFHQYIAALTQLAGFLAPQIHVYDILVSRPIQWTPIVEAVSNTLLALTLATAVLNAREYHYDAD